MIIVIIITTKAKYAMVRQILIIRGEGNQTAPSNGEREEDLGGGVVPHRNLSEKETLVFKQSSISCVCSLFIVFNK